MIHTHKTMFLSLFFEDSHDGLIDTMKALLKPKVRFSPYIYTLHTRRVQGYALHFAPKRKHTLQAFCKKAEKNFRVEITEIYDARVWQKHQQVQRPDKSPYRAFLALINSGVDTVILRPGFTLSSNDSLRKILSDVSRMRLNGLLLDATRFSVSCRSFRSTIRSIAYRSP